MCYNNLAMKSRLEVKYCPRCKKEIAVQKDGNRKKKQCYFCKECERQFIERKYPIAVRSLAVKFRDFGYTYRDIAKIFGIEKSPNTIRNWTLSNPEYDMDYRKQIKFLKEYKTINEEISETKKILEQCKKAIEYKRLKKDYNASIDELVKPQHNETMLVQKQTATNKIDGEMKKLGTVRYISYSRKKIARMREKANKKIEELEKAKSQIENQTALARDFYDIAEIISILKELTSDIVR